MISYINRVAALRCLAWGYYRSTGGFFMEWAVHHHLSSLFFCSGAGSFLLNYTLTYNIWTTLRVACESMGIYACWLYPPFACASLLCDLMICQARTLPHPVSTPDVNCKQRGRGMKRRVFVASGPLLQALLRTVTRDLVPMRASRVVRGHYQGPPMTGSSAAHRGP